MVSFKLLWMKYEFIFYARDRVLGLVRVECDIEKKLHLSQLDPFK